MANIYDIRRYGKLVFLAIAATVALAFLSVSNRLVKDLAKQERERMELWADATKEIIRQLDAQLADDEQLESDSNSTVDYVPSANVDFLLKIINSNTTIPVLLTDDDGNILNYRNFELPEPVDSLFPMNLSDANRHFLEERLEVLSKGSNVIHITIAPDMQQHLYYEDSTMLKRLSYYPYIQLLVMIIFLAVVYFAVLSTKKAEQNKVWVGLSKETAHQLGTPISSLMAWVELLPEMGVDSETIHEMSKDVNRLSTIASRFSKIGSKPQMEHVNLVDIVSHATSYMATRIPGRITLSTDVKYATLPVNACPPLFEWVMENLIKNAVDAMDGMGSINVEIGLLSSRKAYIDVSDTGKGISRKNFKTVFNPGFTSKKRGWGLGLTLAKRIIEQYHDGQIFVRTSTPGVGTTFRIEIPLLVSCDADSEDNACAERFASDRQSSLIQRIRSKFGSKS